MSKEVFQSLFKEGRAFGVMLARSYGSKISSRNISQDRLDTEKKFRLLFNPVIEEFKEHPALDHPFFQYLKEQSQEGFNSRQFAIYRDNFLFRTEATIPSVARTVEKAALSGDMQTVTDTISNLYDEGGYGDPSKVHSKLLLDSHNKHGERIFGLSPLEDLRGARKSPFLVPEVIQYRQAKLSVFNRSFPYIAGNTFAHELAADGMLDNFRKAFFEPYKGYYKPEDYVRLTEYFTAHKDDEKEGGDVEAQHARMAEAAAERACKENIINIPKIRQGGLDFLERQSELWSGLLREIERAKDKVVPVVPMLNYISSAKIPSPHPTKPQLESKTGQGPDILI